MRAEIRRRSGKTSGLVKFGSGEDDVTKTLSTARREELLNILEKMDKWDVDEGRGPAWADAPAYTPPAKREKRKREGQDTEVDSKKDGKERANDATPADSARLIAVCFSEEFYEDVCRSRQTSKDRNDHDLKRVGNKSSPWVRIARAFVGKDFKMDDGGTPSNSVSHAASTAPGVPEMWERLQALDYIAPAIR